MNKLSQRLKELREERGLNQTELSKQINVSQPTIARWEAGDRAPSIDMLILLAQFFKCSTDYLVGLED